MRYYLFLLFLAGVAVISIFGLRGSKSSRPPLEIFPDMDRQARYKPQGENTFFADNRNDRPVVPGTVPFLTDNQQRYPFTAPKDGFYEDDYLASGKSPDGSFGRGIPIPVTHELMQHGRDRYNIYCAVCHGEIGDSNGITKQYGMVGVPSYHQERFREMPEGELYHTIRYGKNTMGAYGAKLSIEERWAVVAYLRALQRAANARLEDVPQEERSVLQP